MKKLVNIKNIKHLQRIFVALICLCLLVPTQSIAQADSTATEKPEPATSSLISPALDLIVIQKGDNSIDLSAALRAKVNGASIKLHLLKINFIQVTDSAEKNLGFLITNGQGKAVFNIKAADIKPGADGKLFYKAVFAGNKQMDPAEGEVAINRARLQIIPVKGDSLNTVQVKLVDITTGAEVPVAETVVGIFVQRSFKPLKIGEGTTDENGEATIEVPGNLPGDAKGNIMLLAKLDEHEKYGNLETAVAQKWGIPVSDQLNELPRALWSSHPPYWMMATFIILMSTVWGHYLVIIVQLFRLRKEEPAADSPLVEHIMPD